jgi:hypothetical protein
VPQVSSALSGWEAVLPDGIGRRSDLFYSNRQEALAGRILEQ